MNTTDKKCVPEKVYEGGELLSPRCKNCKVWFADAENPPICHSPSPNDLKGGKVVNWNDETKTAAHAVGEIIERNERNDASQNNFELGTQETPGYKTTNANTLPSPSCTCASFFTVRGRHKEDCPLSPNSASGWEGYDKKDHLHCWEITGPACGQKIKHFECCLCKKPHPEISQVEQAARADERRELREILEKWIPKKEKMFMAGGGIIKGMTLDDHKRNFAREILSLLTTSNTEIK